MTAKIRSITNIFIISYTSLALYIKKTTSISHSLGLYYNYNMLDAQKCFPDNSFFNRFFQVIATLRCNNVCIISSHMRPVYQPKHNNSSKEEFYLHFTCHANSDLHHHWCPRVLSHHLGVIYGVCKQPRSNSAEFQKLKKCQ